MGKKLLKASEVDDTADAQPFRVEQVEEDAFGRKVYRVVKGDEAEKLNDQEQEQQEDSDNEQQEGEEDEQQGPVFLQKRTVDLKLDNFVGKRQQVSANEDHRNLGVYRCDVCDCTVKDSASWLDHLNGKKHNQMLGMSMKVERVGIDKVKEKFQSLKKQSKAPVENFEDFEKKYEEKQQFKQQIKENKKKKKQEVQKQIQQQTQKEKQNAEQNLTDEQKEMLAMGIPLEMIQ